MLKVLVTGGAGFIGSTLANALVEAESVRNNLSNNIRTDIFGDDTCRVVVLDDLSLGSQSNLSKKVLFVRGSVLDYDLLLELMKDCDCVFHQAAYSSSPMFLEDPRSGTEVNVIGFMNVMESARRNRVKKVIYASSSSLYSALPPPHNELVSIAPRTFYESSFFCRETIARTYNLEYGVDSVGLRYFSIYGPNERHKGNFANTISQFLWDIVEKRKSPVIYGDGSQTRDFTYVYDVVQANILAMNRKKPNSTSANNGITNTDDRRRSQCNYESAPGFNIYNVGTGIQTSFNKVVEIINNLSGTDVKPTYVKNPIKNYVDRTMADLSLSRLELGYEPRWRNAEDGIKHLIQIQYAKKP